MANLGLHVADMDKQFADGVLLLLLIGQLEGFFIPLFDFNLTPVNDSERLQNVTLALDLLNNIGLQLPSIDPQVKEVLSQHKLKGCSERKKPLPQRQHKNPSYSFQMHSGTKMLHFGDMSCGLMKLTLKCLAVMRKSCGRTPEIKPICIASECIVTHRTT
ncbi:hypothetical protein GOODEAATRI_030891 [Goodea atripinnis]|uniref:Calponin-homology (CH) domain-containing protein n=1 Tax=Goodea atripinnis TaxID=208336 RepID=A0ABV0PIF5_9TELE